MGGRRELFGAPKYKCPGRTDVPLLGTRWDTLDFFLFSGWNALTRRKERHKATFSG